MSPWNDHSLTSCSEVIALCQKRGCWHYDIDTVFILVQKAHGSFRDCFLIYPNHFALRLSEVNILTRRLKYGKLGRPLGRRIVIYLLGL